MLPSTASVVKANNPRSLIFPLLGSGPATLTRGGSASAGGRIVEPRRRPAGVSGVEVRAGRDDLVDRVQQLVAELDVHRPELSFELLERARADDRRGHHRIP